MSTEFQDSEFGKFEDATQKVIRLARMLGWRVRWANPGKKVLSVTSPNGHKGLNIPSTNVNSNRLKSYVSALWHHTDRAKWVEVFAGHDDLMKDPLLASIATTLGTSLYVEAADRMKGEEPLPIEWNEPVVQPTEDEEQEVEQSEWRRAPEYDGHGSEWWVARVNDRVIFRCRAHEESFETHDGRSRGAHTASHSASFAEARAKDGATKHAKRIVNTTPWVRASDGVTSTSILDEERADGSHTYRCAKCKFRAATTSAVAGHSAFHRTAEPTEKVVSHLLDGSPVIWNQEPEVPVTGSSDLIDKVRALLGNPVDDAHIRRLEDRVTHLEEQNQHLQGLVDHYRTKAAKAEGDLATLAELIQSVRPS
jgi:hypothetical protein